MQVLSKTLVWSFPRKHYSEIIIQSEILELLTRILSDSISFIQKTLSIADECTNSLDPDVNGEEVDVVLSSDEKSQLKFELDKAETDLVYLEKIEKMALSSVKYRVILKKCLENDQR